MVRNAKKKALYEVILGAGSKTNYERLHSTGISGEPGMSQPETEAASPSNVVRWVRKPRVVQINAGRVEFSVPYQLGIAILLGAILTVLVAFRLGERFGRRQAQITPTTGAGRQIKEQATPAAKAGTNRPALAQPGTGQAAPAARFDTGQAPSTDSGQGGKNRIVIKIYQVREHLEPAKEYFDKLGVATEIIERNNLYYLVSKNKYDNPDRPGTDGYLAKQKIVELGAGYKAPVGYETFGSRPFSDAFGMRFEE